jgi:hypothetical protein
MMKSIPIFAAALAALASCSSKPTEASPAATAAPPIAAKVVATAPPDAPPPLATDSLGMAVASRDHGATVTDAIGGFQIEMWGAPQVSPMTDSGKTVGEYFQLVDEDSDTAELFTVIRTPDGKLARSATDVLDVYAKAAEKQGLVASRTAVTLAGLPALQLQIDIGKGDDANSKYTWIAADAAHGTVYTIDFIAAHVGEHVSADNFAATFRRVTP